MTFKILLDPGHGAGKTHNRGFVNVPGWPYCNEGDNNFIYCQDYLKPALLEYENVEVDMTRKVITDNPTLTARGRMGKGYDLFMSKHTNGANEKAYGSEVFDDCNPAYANFELAQDLVDAIVDVLYTEEEKKNLKPNRGVKYSRYEGNSNSGTIYRKAPEGPNFFTVLKEGYAKTNLLVEVVFHDNYSDIVRFINNMDKVAKAEAAVIAKHYRLKKKGSGAVEEPKEPVIPSTPSNKVKVRKGNQVKEIKRIEKDQENYLHVREFMEFLDHKVDWDEAKQEIVVDGDDVKIGTKFYERNGLYIAENTVDKLRNKLSGKALQNISDGNIEAAINGGVFKIGDAGPNSIWHIAIQDGKLLGNNAFTNDYKKRYKRPTIFIDYNDNIKIQYLDEILSSDDIKDIKDVKLAIGGFGNLSLGYLDLDYEKIPAGDRNATNRTFIGFKGKTVYIGVAKSMTYQMLFASIKKALPGLDGAMALDGGGSSQMKYMGKDILKSTRAIPNMLCFVK